MAKTLVDIKVDDNTTITLQIDIDVSIKQPKKKFNNYFVLYGFIFLCCLFLIWYRFL
jgi:hypothetical protein